MSSEIIVSRQRRLGRIRLNRPEALNSLTLDMVRAFTRALDEFASDPEIIAVLVTGEGERGLCAGGDIRRLYDLRHGDHRHYRDFWREEYQLNARIARFPKPYVVWMDGIVMGGGVGISAHGSCRIVTERTRLAMPETRIGFIPDVGGSWLLSRAGGAGFYMALAGATISGADAIDTGLADLMIESRRLVDLIERLTDLDSAERLEDALLDLRLKPEAGSLKQHKEVLDRVSAASGVEAVIDILAGASTAFARSAAVEIGRNSPTNLKVTFELLRRALNASRLEECLVNEYKAASRLLRSHDLYEGIRAALIDKDKTPRWAPATLEEVSEAAVVEILSGDGEASLEFRIGPS
jgi:enoyl-CoA hydratase